jgi:hypothetical protein
MKIIGKLIYGYDPYCMDISVSPEDMMKFLRKPFSKWFSSVNEWKDEDAPSISNEDFRLEIYQSLSLFNEDDFYVDPADCEWLGFRFDLEDEHSSTELVFTKNVIGAETHLHYEKINSKMFDAIFESRKILNKIRTPGKN